jgi:hypothetical protein
LSLGAGVAVQGSEERTVIDSLGVDWWMGPKFFKRFNGAAAEVVEDQGGQSNGI